MCFQQPAQHIAYNNSNNITDDYSDDLTYHLPTTVPTTSHLSRPPYLQPPKTSRRPFRQRPRQHHTTIPTTSPTTVPTTGTSRPPAEFWGTVTVSGIPAQTGSIITGTIGGNERGRIITTAPGIYGGSGPFDDRLRVYATDQDLSAGIPVVRFTVNGLDADQTAVFMEGSSSYLNLTVSGRHTYNCSTTQPTTLPTTSPTTQPTTVPTTSPTTQPTTVPTTSPLLSRPLYLQPLLRRNRRPFQRHSPLLSQPQLRRLFQRPCRHRQGLQIHISHWRLAEFRLCPHGAGGWF